MLTVSRERVLRGWLVLVGLFSTLAVYPLMHLWPGGWRWLPYHAPYEHMIVSVYAVLGVFLLGAARNPRGHRSLILFAGWSTVAHGAVMGVDAVRIAAERDHLMGDVPVVILAGLITLLLARRLDERGGEPRTQ